MDPNEIKEVVARKQDEMLQDILSHDMRNFIQIILMNAGLLNKGATDDLTKDRIRAIVESCKEASNLVNNSMQTSKLIRERHSLRLSPIKIDDAIGSAYRTVTRLSPHRNISCTNEIRGDGLALANYLLPQDFVNIFQIR